MGLVHWASLINMESLFKVEGRCVEYDIIPYVGHLVLGTIPIEGWIINPYEHGLHDSPGNSM